MDVLDLVRDLGSDAELDARQIGAARARLATMIADTESGRRRHKAWAVGGGISGLVVIATATAVVVAVVASPAGDANPAPTVAGPVPSITVVPEPQPTRTPTAVPGAVTAAGVLENAAALASSSTGSEIAGGRYLRVENNLEQLVLYAPDAPDSPYNATRATANAAWVSTSTYVTYIPADRSGEWVRVFEPERRIIATYGTDAEVLSSQWLSEVVLGEQIVERYQGGMDFVGGVPIYASDAYFAQMPLDPRELLDWYRARMVAGNVENVEEGVVDVIVQDLELNAAPADLRAAMFRALSLIPAVEVASVEGRVTTLRFNYAYYGAAAGTVSIDTETGLVTASSTTRGSGGVAVPDSVPDHRVTTTITVVDAAP